MAKVKAHVYVTADGYPVLLRPGDEVPAGVTVTNPEVVDSPVVAEAPKAEDDKETKAPAKRPARKADAES